MAAHDGTVFFCFGSAVLFLTMTSRFDAAFGFFAVPPEHNRSGRCWRYCVVDGQKRSRGQARGDNAATVGEKLLPLLGRIPGLQEPRAGTKFLDSTAENAELVLVTRHDDVGLAAHAAHPEHLAVAFLLQKTAAGRNAVDFME